MNEQDQEFLHDMVLQLDETIRKLVEEEGVLCQRLGEMRVIELKEFWNQELSDEEEVEFKRTLDYWEKILIRTWAHLKRTYRARADVGKAFMMLNSKL
jgi:hypothetical protein